MALQLSKSADLQTTAFKSPGHVRACEPRELSEPGAWAPGLGLSAPGGHRKTTCIYSQAWLCEEPGNNPGS